jgi:hypothetical protein
MARGRDRIIRCIGRTGYPARKSIRKAPAQKARRGLASHFDSEDKLGS